MLPVLELIPDCECQREKNFLFTPKPSKKLSTPDASIQRTHSLKVSNKQQSPKWTEEDTLNLFVENTVTILSGMGFDAHDVFVFAWDALSSHNVIFESQLVDLVLKKLTEVHFADTKTPPERKRKNANRDSVCALDMPAPHTPAAPYSPHAPSLELIEDSVCALDMPAPHTPAAPSFELIDKHTGGCKLPDTPCNFGGSILPGGLRPIQEDVEEDLFYDDLDWDYERISVFSLPDLHCLENSDSSEAAAAAEEDSSSEDPNLFFEVLKVHNEKDEKLQQDLFADLVSKYY